METFTQELPRDSIVKLEVSSEVPTVCEQSSDESSPSPHLSLQQNPSLALPHSSPDMMQTDKYEFGSLPPRKRAKTQEEKEQRRIERIMRNRQAAHASREKKRKHLEALESKCSALESENTQLRMALFQSQNLRARVEQLEMLINLVKSSGDISHLNTPEDSNIHTPSASAAINEFDGTVNGSMLGMSSSQVNDNMPQQPSSQAQAELVGSPVPSLIEDCASPESLAVKREEEDFFLNAFPDTGSSVEQDPFEVLNFSFDTKPALSMVNETESLLKSRHPAAVTYHPPQDHTTFAY